MIDNQSQTIEVVNTSLEQIERAQYDVAVNTAQKYPRNITHFHRDAIALVKMDQETAESCIFRRPVGKKDGREEYAEGMSVRMAEIVAACYGNIVYGSYIIEQTDRMVKARGQARDIQRNVTASSEVVESTVTKDGRPFSERMRIVVAKAALSKARRDALFQVVPRALCKPIETAARQVITGSQKPLAERRAAVVSWISKTSIAPARVWAALGITSEVELNDEHLLELQGIRNAIKDGECTIDDAFPKPESETKSTADLLKPKEKKETKPDPRSAVMAIVEARGLTFADFVECLVSDGAIKPQDAGTIKTIADVPDAILRDYLEGDKLAQGLNFIVENRNA